MQPTRTDVRTTALHDTPWRSLIAAMGLALLMLGTLLTGESHGQEVEDATLDLPLAPVQYLPIVGQAGTPQLRQSDCPLTSTLSYGTVTVLGASTDRVPARHGDLNLALRGYVSATATLDLVAINGPTDTHAPQLAAIFIPPERRAFHSAYQIYHWDWTCGTDGCRSTPISSPEITLLALAATPGEPLSIPARQPLIDGGGYVAMVLYAEQKRITLTYTRGDTVAHGYAIHLEDICVDPNLLALYQTLDSSGRRTLPALRNGDLVGKALYDHVKVAVRDTGSFMDPRSGKDWWQRQ